MAPRTLLCLALCLTAGAGCSQPGRGGTEQPSPCPLNSSGRVGFPQRQAGVQDFCFDGVTRQPDAPVSFRQDDVIRVVVTNANPFLYEYEIRANEQRVREASIADFFKVSLGITLPGLPALPAQTGGGAPAGPAAVPSFSGCSAAEEVTAVALQNSVESLRRDRDAIGTRFDDLTRYSRAQEDTFADHRKVYLDPMKTADLVQTAALAGATVLRQTADSLTHGAAALERTIDMYTSRVTAVSQEAEDAAAENGACVSIAAVAADAKALARDAAALRSGLEPITKKAEELTATREKFEPTANDRNRFHVTSILKRIDAPTDVTVTIARRPAGTSESYGDVASQRFNVGGRARFSFSAGFGWTSVGNRDYGVARQFVTPPAGTPQDTVIQTVVAREDSDDRVFPFVTFNTRLSPDVWAVNPQLVVGVGVSRATSDPVPGYLVGLGMDAFAQRLLLTGGFFFAEEERLSGGLRPGDRVPGSLTEAPVHKRLVGKLSIGVSYRIF